MIDISVLQILIDIHANKNIKSNIRMYQLLVNLNWFLIEKAYQHIVQTPPLNWDNINIPEIRSNDHIEVDENVDIPEACDHSYSHLIGLRQNELNDLVRNLDLSKQQPELLDLNCKSGICWQMKQALRPSEKETLLSQHFWKLKVLSLYVLTLMN